MILIAGKQTFSDDLTQPQQRRLLLYRKKGLISYQSALDWQRVAHKTCPKTTRMVSLEHPRPSHTWTGERSLEFIKFDIDRIA